MVKKRSIRELSEDERAEEEDDDDDDEGIVQKMKNVGDEALGGRKSVKVVLADPIGSGLFNKVSCIV